MDLPPVIQTREAAPAASEGSRRARRPLRAAAWGAALLTVCLSAGGALASNAEPGSPPAQVDEPYPSLDSLFTLYQPYLGSISAYQPIRFLVGTAPKKSAFQVSFKYRLLSPRGSLARSSPWVQGLHLAYTQTSFWDLQSSSTPFEDTSYEPELFLLSPNLGARPTWVRGLFAKGGLRHESNGRGADLSRSTNFLYAEPTLLFFDPESLLGLQLSPRAWVYVANDDETNPGLADYRGYWELEVKAGRADGLVVGAELRWARKGGSILADATYPLHRLLFGNLDIYLQVQYVNALAESLIDYRSRTEALRFGVALVR